MPRTKKTTTKKVTRAPKKVATVVPMPEPAVMPMPTMPAKRMQLSPKVLASAVVLIAIALLTYKFGPWLVPAVVNGTPITRFSLWARLDQTYGAQTLDNMVNEKVLDDTIAKSGVKVDQTQVTAQMTALENQYQSVGGLNVVLAQQGMTRAELEKQISTQLAVEQILKDKITPTDAEIQAEFTANANTTYKGKTLADVKSDITNQLEQSKLNDAFLAWFTGVKKNAKVFEWGASTASPSPAPATSTP